MDLREFKRECILSEHENLSRVVEKELVATAVLRGAALGSYLIAAAFAVAYDFSIAAIVYGVPVLGSGGLYFGKLSNATATQVPKTNNGTFDPVIVFGLGLQLGLGYNFTKGPLSAGFALTVFGIVEGVIAPWHPYGQSSRSTALTVSDAVMQSGYYFKLSGMVGVIGLLYGKVDFAIIQAAVNVKITLSLQCRYTCLDSFAYRTHLPDGTHWETVQDEPTTAAYSVGLSYRF